MVAPPMTDQLESALSSSWARNLETQARRVATQERAIVALLTGSLDEETRAAAQADAHKLAGILGSFGLHDASDAAIELEAAWLGDDPQPAQLASIVATLRSQLQEQSATVPSGWSLADLPTMVDGPVDVVVVDDDEALADFVMQTLSSTQHQVTWLPDGDSARDAICGPTPRLRPRLLLLDVEMPGLDGFGILQALARSGDLDNMSVIMLTRRTTTEDIVRARRLGAVDYLAKPVEAPLLLERVDRVLSQSPAATR